MFCILAINAFDKLVTIMKSHFQSVLSLCAWETQDKIEDVFIIHLLHNTQIP